VACLDRDGAVRISTSGAELKTEEARARRLTPKSFWSLSCGEPIQMNAVTRSGSQPRDREMMGNCFKLTIFPKGRRMAQWHVVRGWKALVL
jgi:hypothetical protein